MDISRTIRYQMPCQASGQTAKQVWNVYTLKTARGSFFEIGIPLKKPRSRKQAKPAPAFDEEALKDAAAHITECAQDCGFPTMHV